MASCSEKCAVFDGEYDDFRQLSNDIGPEDAHFCQAYDGPIPDGIFDGPKECPYFWDKSEVKGGT